MQDAYTLRCIPQVHGISVDTCEWVHSILSTEMNSATDNPMVLAETGEIISGGNFHGEYPAKALDFLAIAVHVRPGATGRPRACLAALTSCVCGCGCVCVGCAFGGEGGSRRLHR